MKRLCRFSLVAALVSAGAPPATAHARQALHSHGDSSKACSLPSGKGLLIDNFEDGDSLPRAGGTWFAFTDQEIGGASTIDNIFDENGLVVMSGRGYRSRRSLRLDYSLDSGALPIDAFVGFGVTLGSPEAPFDLSEYEGLRYRYKGGAHHLRVQTFGVTDFDYHEIALPAASSHWRKVEIAFSQLRQVGFGSPVPFDPTNGELISIVVSGATGHEGTLRIDDLKLKNTIRHPVPDLPLLEPAPPPDAVIESIEVDNPLQPKAMQYLHRGYNLTNWLEQERFDGFRYGEDTVQKLADAGFQSLRLPIDLDLYVEQAIPGIDGLELVLHDDLFLILDAFDTWTAKHGLSLTIDYHQYDDSLSMNEPLTLATAVAAWSRVAEHFADNPRDDLFFELLNEPEFSFAEGQTPSQDEWTVLAEEMIGAIRAHDTRHTILFGDVQWYGIDALSTRTPLSDENIIYVFHTYDPFLFTHQGAEWADMAPIHDIPYPYTVERWSEHFSGLGFDEITENFILDLARNYHRQGNRSTVRNHIVEAKRWAVKHGVPVICNEFGVYDATSRKEDRVRYYEDVVEIFEELEIPWQHWFMLMDENGVVDPTYRAAFQLDP